MQSWNLIHAHVWEALQLDMLLVLLCFWSLGDSLADTSYPGTRWCSGESLFIRISWCAFMVLSTTSYCDPINKFQWSAHERIRKWKTSLPGKCILAIIWNCCGNFYANCDGATIHLGIMWDPWLRCPGCSCPWDALRHCMECWWVGVPNTDFMITSFRLLCEVAEVSFEMGWYCLLTKSGMPCFLQVTYWASWPSSMSATQWLILCEFSLPCQLNLLSHEDRDFLKFAMCS